LVYFRSSYGIPVHKGKLSGCCLCHTYLDRLKWAESYHIDNNYSYSKYQTPFLLIHIATGICTRWVVYMYDYQRSLELATVLSNQFSQDNIYHPSVVDGIAGLGNEGVG